jgi:G patch domain-containing protein 1
MLIFKKLPPPPTTTDTSTKLHDGRSVLAGFVLSSKPVAEDRWFTLPDIPKGWIPNPKRVWEKDQGGGGGDAKKENEPPPPPQSSRESWKSGISADEVTHLMCLSGTLR